MKSVLIALVMLVTTLDLARADSDIARENSSAKRAAPSGGAPLRRAKNRCEQKETVVDKGRELIQDLGQTIAPLARKETYLAALFQGPSAISGAVSRSNLDRIIGEINVSQYNTLVSFAGTNNPVTDTSTTFDFSDAAEDVVFASILGRSRNQAVCRQQFLQNYEKSPQIREQVNARAKTEFDKVKVELEGLLQYSQDAMRFMLLNSSGGGDAGKGNLQLPAVLQERSALFAKLGSVPTQSQLDDAERRITSLIMNLPMGYDPDVQAAVREMGERGSFDSEVYRRGMANSSVRYFNTIKAFEEISEPIGNDSVYFCVNPALRRDIGESGQLQNFLQELPESLGPARVRITERMINRYERGPIAIDGAVLIGSLALAIPSGGSSIAVATAGTAGAVVRTTAAAGRIISAPGRAALSALTNVLDVSLAIDGVVQSCTQNSKLVINAEKTCDPSKELENALNGFNGSSCVMNAAAATIGLGAPALNYIRRLRTTGRGLAQAPGRLSDEVTDEIVVQAPKKGREAAARARQGRRVADSDVAASRSSTRTTESSNEGLSALERESLADGNALRRTLSTQGNPEVIISDLNSILSRRPPGSIDEFFSTTGGRALTKTQQNEVARLVAKLKKNRLKIVRQNTAKDLRKLRGEGQEIKSFDCRKLNALNREPAFESKAACSRITFKKENNNYCSCGGAGKAGNWLLPCAETFSEYLAPDAIIDRAALPANSRVSHCRRVSIKATNPPMNCFHGGLGPTMGGFGGGAQILCAHSDNFPRASRDGGPTKLDIAVNEGLLPQGTSLPPKWEVTNIAVVHPNPDVRKISLRGRECLSANGGVCRASDVAELQREVERLARDPKAGVSAVDKKYLDEYLEYLAGKRSLKPDGEYTGLLSTPRKRN